MQTLVWRQWIWIKSFDLANKKVIDKMKDECRGIPTKKVIGLK